jgi:23S rRNA (adenine2503-C2)-methyltransferase
MSSPVVLQSKMDMSVNFVTKGDFPGVIEARYVRRCEEYFIIYLSSQTGCGNACRMCHLTQSGQTEAQDVTGDAILRQAGQVFEWYDTQASPAKVVHFNFMARGEPFSSQVLLKGADDILSRLADKAIARSLIPRFKFSTIMPRELSDTELIKIFPRHNPDIYYSLYSMDIRFRKRWLPKALPAEVALSKLREYQEVTRKIPVIHWAFIAGENDDEETVYNICEAVRSAGLRVDFNIVRYNPYSCDQGFESSEQTIERNAEILMRAVPGARVKVVTRVGLDVKASCGMFIRP